MRAAIVLPWSHIIGTYNSLARTKDGHIVHKKEPHISYTDDPKGANCLLSHLFFVFLPVVLLFVCDP